MIPAPYPYTVHYHNMLQWFVFMFIRADPFPLVEQQVSVFSRVLLCHDFTLMSLQNTSHNYNVTEWSSCIICIDETNLSITKLGEKIVYFYLLIMWVAAGLLPKSMADNTYPFVDTMVPSYLTMLFSINICMFPMWYIYIYVCEFIVPLLKYWNDDVRYVRCCSICMFIESMERWYVVCSG